MPEQIEALPELGRNNQLEEAFVARILPLVQCFGEIHPVGFCGEDAFFAARSSCGAVSREVARPWAPHWPRRRWDESVILTAQRCRCGFRLIPPEVPKNWRLGRPALMVILTR